MHRSALGPLCLIAASALTAPTSAWSQEASVCPEGGRGSVVYVRGDVDRPLDLTRQDLERLPRQRLQLAEPEADVAEYEAVALADILAHAGVSVESLRGPQAATVVVAEASDGYRVAFALAELDSAFSDRLIVLADRKDGVALTANEGPYRVVMRGERRHSRWIRQVRCLRVVRP